MDKKIINVATIYTLYERRAGAELYFEKIIEEFSKAKLKINTKFIVFCNDSAAEVLKKKAFDNVVIVYKSELNNQYRKAIWLQWSANQEIINRNADCVWIPSGTNHFIGKTKIPSIVTFHDFGEYHIKNKYGFVRTIYRKLICIRSSIKRADEITSVSHTTAKDLERYWNKNSTVIYSGPSPQSTLFYWKSDKEALQYIETECGVKLKRPFFFTPGRTDYIGKGLDTIFEVSEYFEQSFVLCGPEGEGHDKLIEKIQQSSDNIMFLGRVSDQCMSALYFLCEAVVFASRYEGFGFPVLEAFQNKCILIVSDGGALPEITKGCGLVFNAGCSNSLRQRITDFLNLTSDDKERLVLCGLKRLEMFSWLQTVKQMNELFVKLVIKK